MSHEPLNQASIGAGARALDQLRQMTASLEEGLAALSANSLGGIEESLWTQETLSALLRRSVHALREARIAPSEAGDLRAAAARLLALNRSYELVVKDATRTAALLRTLAGGSGHEHSAHPAAAYTLSYEI
jgi:hypothetical protein